MIVKRLLWVMLYLVFAVNVSAGEVAYFNKPWKEVLAKAKAENKYIVVDCYTDWCGWCKVMDKETMANDEVIAMVHQNYIAVKMDMEHGEGVKMAMKYHVSGFPSFLYFNPEGRYVYQSAGYQKKDAFLAELKKVLQPSEQIYAPGFTETLDIDFPDFYKNAFAENGKRTFPTVDEVQSFMRMQRDPHSEVSWGVISKFDVGDKYTYYFLANVERYRKIFGKVSVNDKLNKLLGTRLEEATKVKSDSAFEVVLQMVGAYMGEEAAMSKIYCRLSYNKGVENWEQYAVAASDYIDKQGFNNTDYVNTLSWDLYEHCNNQSVLKKSVDWMKRVSDQEPTYAYLDTYASLLYKTGSKKKAKATAQKAIAVGNENKIDVKETELLLEKIKASK
jgi:thioredoxin-related protein